VKDSDIIAAIAPDAVSLMDKAIAEIKRLRQENATLTAERDEARRSCCEFAAMVDSADTVLMYVDSNRFQEIAIRYMKSRGWDCYKKEDGK
jgi:hypothetical protein